MMGPSSPATEDALQGLVRLMSNPDAFAKKLAEYVSTRDSAERVLAQARAESEAADVREAALAQRERKLAADEDELASLKIAHAHDAEQHAIMRGAFEKAHGTREAHLIKKQSEIEDRERALALAEAKVAARERAIGEREAAVREGITDLEARKAKLREIVGG